MTDLSEKTLYEIFSIAIEEERKAQELYRQAATLAGEGTPLATMFLQLADDEAAHEKVLMADYRVFKTTLEEQKAVDANA